VDPAGAVRRPKRRSNVSSLPTTVGASGGSKGRSRCVSSSHEIARPAPARPLGEQGDGGQDEGSAPGPRAEGARGRLQPAEAQGGGGSGHRGVPNVEHGAETLRLAPLPTRRGRLSRAEVELTRSSYAPTLLVSELHRNAAKPAARFDSCQSQHVNHVRNALGRGTALTGAFRMAACTYLQRLAAGLRPAAQDPRRHTRRDRPTARAAVESENLPARVWAIDPPGGLAVRRRR
jgi:hypothetical protein